MATSTSEEDKQRGQKKNMTKEALFYNIWGLAGLYQCLIVTFEHFNVSLLNNLILS